MGKQRTFVVKGKRWRIHTAELHADDKRHGIYTGEQYNKPFIKLVLRRQDYEPDQDYDREYVVYINFQRHIKRADNLYDKEQQVYWPLNTGSDWSHCYAGEIDMPSEDSRIRIDHRTYTGPSYQAQVYIGLSRLIAKTAREYNLNLVSHGDECITALEAIKKLGYHVDVHEHVHRIERVDA